MIIFPMVFSYMHLELGKAAKSPPQDEASFSEIFQNVLFWSKGQIRLGWVYLGADDDD